VQRGILALLHRGVGRIHVDVDDLADWAHGRGFLIAGTLRIEAVVE
jgi:hypothetical protein